MPHIRLGEIAYARSGDKGAGANVGVIANTAADFELLCRFLTAEVVEAFFQPLGVGRVVRYELPNLLALNFLLPNILDGGGSLSLRTDAQGKTLGQSLLEMRVEMPDGMSPRESDCSAVARGSGVGSTAGTAVPHEEALRCAQGDGLKPSVCIDSSDPLVTLVTLDRPEKRNALSVDMIDGLYRALLGAEQDANRRAIVFRGAGPAFCAGLDLNEAADAAMAQRSAESLARLYGAIWRSPLVTLAAAHGAAFGGGAGLLAACDRVVAADELKIGFPEVRRGLVAALVTCMLRRQVSDRALREMVLWGQPFSARQAVSVGLVNQVAEAAEVLPLTLQIATEACQGAPGAVARTKRLLDELGGRPIEADLKLALSYHIEARNSNEAAEGIAAFREKREPKWGRRGKC